MRLHSVHAFELRQNWSFIRTLILGVLLLGLSVESEGADSEVKVTGQRTFICGHSFHVFVAERLPIIERAAGIPGGTIVGTQFIGGSEVIQHWQRPDGRNKVKEALSTKGVDVLTLAPKDEVPNAGVEKFADLAFTMNPDIRVLVQMSWPLFDLKNAENFKNEDRNAQTLTELESMQGLMKDYRNKLAAQVESINARHGRSTVALVPAGQAVLALRMMVLRGQVPSISRPSELFKDDRGHPQELVKELVSYCTYAVIYRRTPEGLACFTEGDSNRKEANRLIQKLAWEVVTAEPLAR